MAKMMINQDEKKITLLGGEQKRKRPYLGNLNPRKKIVTAKRSKPKDSEIGLLKKKKFISDIDKDDVDNILAAVEYVEDLYEFYRCTESLSQVGDYMDQQNEIDVHMRTELVDWLIGVHHNELKLPPEVLHLTVSIVDRILALNRILSKDLLLLGLTAMFIASKYEEDYPPGVEDYVVVSCGVCNIQQILAMERLILAELGWTLSVPTTYHFLVRFIKAAGGDKEMEKTSFYMAELGLMQYSMIRYSPSMLAAAAVYAAKRFLNVTPLWNETLKFHTGYSESQVIECASKLESFHCQAAYKEYMSYALTL